METPNSYEYFPWSIVLMANVVTLSVFAIGAYLWWNLGFWWAGFYLLYCVWIEWRLLRKGCVNCYYYGKVCGFGKGKLCSLLFERGDPQKFGATPFSWRDLVPDFGVVVLPLIGAIISLLGAFRWPVLVLVVVLIVLWFGGNAVVRGHFACRYCKQKEIGCPAEELFSGRT